LARRPHFSAELEAKLRARGFSPDDITVTLARLQAAGYLDDRRTAGDLARGPLSRKGFGPRRVRAELERRGVASDIVEDTVKELFEDEKAEFDAASEVVARWVRRNVRDPAALARRLDRMGYSKRVILELLEGLKSGSRRHD
jgi:regulatory protein